MKSSVYTVLFAVLGILLAVAPWTFAPVCEVHGDYVQTVTGKQLPMPCGYTARAEIGVGALVVVSGLMLLYAKSPDSKRIVGAFGISLGILAILFPTYIIGMCASADHSCRLLTQPVLILVGLALIAISLVLMKNPGKW